MGITLLSFIIVLGVLIFFHEFGHFLIARFFGVGVEKFSLGFGPRLIGKKIGRTDYRISAIPLGGYVKMVGEEPDAEVESSDIAISFTHKHVFKRMCIVAAGPVFNILLAVIIFFIIFLVSMKSIFLIVIKFVLTVFSFYRVFSYFSAFLHNTVRLTVILGSLIQERLWFVKFITILLRSLKFYI